MPMERWFYRRNGLSPEERARLGRLATAGEGYVVRFDFNETSDARPPRGWGGAAGRAGKTR